ncbi:class I SAM-dependent methyltransferase [Paractinoplanes toevensis]|uniref:Methyltransferase n=1 Tax=Paractinoplanes toevensis TaxID=571911 RepID=A0A919W603_9ACTN|nr:class I SAM-dependent methyltransferase [Actinoplanes toevensis]GIM93800.1 methyltransferase [Actinoplanes toevensis]
MAETHFGEWIAAHYATLWPELFDPALIGATVGFLAGLAPGGGSALEFGVGTGRIAIPLQDQGLEVYGMELSPAMAAHLDGTGVEVLVGDYATAHMTRTFDIVYLLRNTITNLVTQDEQVRAFENAAAHLRPGGCFVVENYIPRLRDRVFAETPEHLGVEEYDLATQIAVSRHRWIIDGEQREFSSPHRYVWPAELDLMARIAGLRLRERWSDWHRAPFTAASTDHVSVWAKPFSHSRAVPNS